MNIRFPSKDDEAGLCELADRLYQFVGQYQDYAQEKKTYGTDELVSMAEAHMLLQIVNNPGTTVSELAERIHRTKSFVSQAVKKLIEYGLVYKVKYSGDGRVYRLFPTEKGETLHRYHIKYDAQDVSETLDALRRDCSEEEIVAFFRVVEIYRRLLTE